MTTRQACCNLKIQLSQRKYLAKQQDMLYSTYIIHAEDNDILT